MSWRWDLHIWRIGRIPCFWFGSNCQSSVKCNDQLATASAFPVWSVGVVSPPTLISRKWCANYANVASFECAERERSLRRNATQRPIYRCQPRDLQFDPPTNLPEITSKTQVPDVSKLFDFNLAHVLHPLFVLCNLVNLLIFNQLINNVRC